MFHNPLIDTCIHPHLKLVLEHFHHLNKKPCGTLVATAPSSYVPTSVCKDAPVFSSLCKENPQGISHLAFFLVPCYLLGVDDSLLHAHGSFCLSVCQLLDTWMTLIFSSMNICQQVFACMRFHFCQVRAQQWVALPSCSCSCPLSHQQCSGF